MKIYLSIVGFVFFLTAVSVFAGVAGKEKKNLVIDVINNPSLITDSKMANVFSTELKKLGDNSDVLKALTTKLSSTKTTDGKFIPFYLLLSSSFPTVISSKEYGDLLKESLISPEDRIEITALAILSRKPDLFILHNLKNAFLQTIAKSKCSYLIAHWISVAANSILLKNPGETESLLNASLQITFVDLATVTEKVPPEILNHFFSKNSQIFNRLRQDQIKTFSKERGLM